MFFINAKNLHYGFDLCPAFWNWLIRANRDRKAYSIQRVGNELRQGDDEWADWTGERDDAFFLPPTQAFAQALRDASNWVTERGYESYAVSQFLAVADAYWVAYALAEGYIVVTHEVAAPSSKKVVKVPDSCLGLGVKYMVPYAMLRQGTASVRIERVPQFLWDKGTERASAP